MRRVTRCPACDAGAGEPFLAAAAEQRERYLLFSHVKYAGLLDGWLDELELVILRCRFCGHHWYRDQPSLLHLSEMYAAGVPLAGGLRDRRPEPYMNRAMRRFRTVFDARSPILLDYGSGHGRWARAAAGAGFVVCAFDPSSERGREDSPPFELIHDRRQLLGRSFDAVNLEQVLEHVRDPFEVLRQIHVLCLPHAVVRVSVPNVLRCPEGRDLWQSWPFDGHRPHTMAPFEHLHGFTPASLAALARRAGFRWVPLWRAGTTYLPLFLRRVAGRAWPALGQTAALLEPDREGA
jgi:SAM-dependent methyltransferase